MEPNKEPQDKNDDLHSEGIDVVGSGVSFDNEFSTGATDERIPEPPPQAQQPAPEPTPQAPAIVPKPVAAPLPQAPKEMPPAAKQSFSASVPAQKQPVPLRDDPSIHPLRTFKTDAEEAVRYGSVSKIDMAVAEQNKREASGQADYVEDKKSHAGLYVGLAALIIALAAGGWYYWNASKPQGQPASVAPATVNIKTLVPYAKGSVAVIGQSANPLALIGSKLAAANAGIDNVYAVIVLATATSTAQAPVAGIFATTHMPSRLQRSLGSNYMFGSYVYEVEAPFVVLTDTFYQNAFSGMLDWEKDLAGDFAGMIKQSYPTTELANIDSRAFTDTVISNVDVRVLRDASGKTMLAYAFADKDTIVVTTSESALKYLLDKLLQVRTIQ